jgi:SAM-dependent methyltransferase
MAAESWAVALFRRSVLKQRKLAEIQALLGRTDQSRCLDLGSDNGVISLMLRQGGGRWASADLTEEAVHSIRELVASDVHLVTGARLPFPPGEFDRVAVVDMLEHVEDERAFVAELARVTRPGGRLVVNTPHLRDTPLRRVRDRVGLTDEKHGHVRPGYTAEGLRHLLEESGKFSWETHHTYSRAFTEAVDLAINFGIARLGKGHSAKGMVVTGTDVARYGNAFRAYAALYPAVRAFAGLDRLIPWIPGYMLIAAANRVGN